MVILTAIIPMKLRVMIKNNKFLNFRYFLAIILLIIIGIIFFLPISRAFIAEGLLSYDYEKRSIKYLENAIIDEVFVKNGEQVKMGQKLMAFLALKQQIDTNILEWKLISLIIKKQLYEFEHKKYYDSNHQNWFKEINLIFKKLTPKQSQKIAYQIAISQNYLKSALEKYHSELKIFQQKQQILQENIRQNQKKEAIILKQIHLARQLLQKRLENVGNLLELEKTHLDLSAKINGDYKQIDILKSELEAFRSENNMQITKNILDLTLDKEINQFQLNLAEDLYQKATIYSPIDGVVDDILSSKSQEIIGAGEVLMNIIPASKQLIIIAKIKSTDIDNVFLDQEVEIFFKNFYEKNLPKIKGKIFEIAKDVEIDKISGQNYFQAKINITSKIDNLTLSSGMPVEVYILQKTRSIGNYLLAPILKSINHSFNDLQ